MDQECFFFSLSPTTIHSITLDIQLATVCISDDDGMKDIAYEHVLANETCMLCLLVNDQ